MSIPICVVIMAGGEGQRLWPRSNSDTPKQFQSFFGGEVLLNQTLSLVMPFVPRHQTYVITSNKHLERTRLLVGKDIKVVGEPTKRDTAACMGLATANIIKDHSEDVIIAFLPCDHWIDDQEYFSSTLEKAAKLAKVHDCLVTIGVRPTRPESGFGYVEVEKGEGDYFLVKEFKEKPSLEEAKQLILNKNVFWNNGIFVARASVMRDLFKEYLPNLASGLEFIYEKEMDSEEFYEAINAIYKNLTPISFDYGVLQKLKDFILIPAEYQWDDIGSWSAFTRIHRQNQQGNLLSGKVSTIDTKGCLVDTPDLKTSLIGVENMVVVQEGDQLLICDIDHAQDIKQIAADNDMSVSYSGNKIVLKPWGREIWWAVTSSYAAKILEVKAGERLSLQYHRRKKETLLFERGEGEMILGETRFSVYPGMTITVEPTVIHQIIAKSNLRIIEVSTPDLDDVVRLHDNYGRCDNNS
ncbi:mannose-1-phosphate guanylyltransferase [Priestia megaterium]|uniref:mannose-1-phosphate guanylyltransferase n=1 Tax=Priestia megaterium TaxID=1404 RepID=UPI00203FADD4|nr:sugar phosphate nucleotidyltransferase [Priestia megaterium]MCM3197192.1 sugar phosphate nucleotidyltransferase [Priestia megaterium]